MTKIKNFEKKFMRKIAVRFDNVYEMQEFLFNCEINNICNVDGYKIKDERREYAIYNYIRFKANKHITKEILHISKNKILLSNTRESFWKELGFKVLDYDKII